MLLILLQLGSSSQKIWLDQTEHSSFFLFGSPFILFSYNVSILSLLSSWAALRFSISNSWIFSCSANWRCLSASSFSCWSLVPSVDLPSPAHVAVAYQPPPGLLDVSDFHVGALNNYYSIGIMYDQHIIWWLLSYLSQYPGEPASHSFILNLPQSLHCSGSYKILIQRSKFIVSIPREACLLLQTVGYVCGAGYCSIYSVLISFLYPCMSLLVHLGCTEKNSWLW